MTLSELKNKLEETYVEWIEDDWLIFLEVWNYDKEKDDYEMICRIPHPLTYLENQSSGCVVQAVKLEKTTWDEIMKELQKQTELKDIQFMFIERTNGDVETKLRIAANSNSWVLFEPENILRN